MKNTTSRRLFLRNSAFAITGIAVISPTITTAFNSDASPYLGYNPYAERKTDLRSGILSLNPVTVRGTIYQSDGVTPVTNATVEVWHLSPNSAKYRHRAKIIANEQGNYEFITDFINREKGKNARIYFKISSTEKTSFTELLLNNSGAHITSEHWERNQKLGTKLFPERTVSMDQTHIQFNISI